MHIRYFKGYLHRICLNDTISLHSLLCLVFFYAWGLPPGEHYSKRPHHGQERAWRADVQSKKNYAMSSLPTSVTAPMTLTSALDPLVWFHRIVIDQRVDPVGDTGTSGLH